MLIENYNFQYQKQNLSSKKFNLNGLAKLLIDIYSLKLYIDINIIDQIIDDSINE